MYETVFCKHKLHAHYALPFSLELHLLLCVHFIMTATPALNSYLSTYQNQNVGHQVKTMCMYTIDEQDVSKILGFQRLSSSREVLNISD